MRSIKILKTFFLVYVDKLSLDQDLVQEVKDNQLVRQRYDAGTVYEYDDYSGEDFTKARTEGWCL